MTFSSRLVLCIGAATILMLAGCATQREVVGNHFISDFPKMDITVSKEFKYVGMQDIGTAAQNKYGGPPKTGRRSTEYYNWNEIARKEGAPYRAFYIRIATQMSPKWVWVTPVFDRYGKNVLDHEILTFGDIHYEKALRVTSIKGRADCVLMDSVANTSYKTIFVEIAYWESVKDTGFTCEQWLDKDHYTDGQKQYVAEFRKRADQAFEPRPAFLTYSQKIPIDGDKEAILSELDDDEPEE
jgi:hypothetical protein